MTRPTLHVFQHYELASRGEDDFVMGCGPPPRVLPRFLDSARFLAKISVAGRSNPSRRESLLHRHDLASPMPVTSVEPVDSLPPTRLSDLADEQLVTRFQQAGCTESLDELLRRHLRRVRS